jgi:protein SCO1/2
MSKLAIFFLALLMLMAGSTVLVLAYRTMSVEDPVVSGTYQERVLPAEPLEDFQLTAQNGQRFDSSSLKGDVWIASFFFASCPATCRRQNEAIADLQRRYGDQGVKFVSISVDPASDDPQTLSTYAQGFNADPDKWFFLTDRSKSIDYIRRVGQDMFKVPITTQGHADTLILVNRNGEIHDYYNWKKPERIAELYQHIEKRLAEEPRVEPTEEETGSDAQQSAAVDDAREPATTPGSAGS